MPSRPFPGLGTIRLLPGLPMAASTLPIRIREPYRTANCLHCHGESRVFRDKHVDFAVDGDVAALACLDCHAPAHPEERGS